MAHAMDSIMQIKPLFAGVGAAHLPNSYGMVNLLRQKGYTVTSVLQNKSNNGADRKEKIEGIFLDNKFNKTTSYDGVVNFKLPGTFFEFPESDGVKLGVYPDMANGARYLVTRISTFAPLYGLTPKEYSSKIDSLLFENIPGKIIKKEFESVEEGERISILSKTKKGDFEKYLIHISPIEVAIFKVGGKKEFVKRNDASSFISSATYKKTNNHWSRFTPENNAYSVLLPGLIVHEVENNAFMPDYASKSVQSVSDSNGYFLVLNRSYGDMDFMEEDSFELRQFAQSFYKQFNYNISSAKQTIFKDYSAIKVIGEYSGETRTHEQMAELHAMILCVGKQYYLLAAQTSNLKAVDQFFNSFELKAFEYNQPFKKQYDTARLFSTLTTVTPPVENGYYNYYYGRDDEEDDSFKEKTKIAIYKNRSTDEVIYVNFKRFHKYYQAESIDSLWSLNKRKLLEYGKFFVRSESKESVGNVHSYLAEVGDTNSGRNIYAKYVVKDGVMHFLFTETDFRTPKSAFVTQFYDNFTPWDSTIGLSVLESKSDLFLNSLVSNDSLTQNSAEKSFNIIEFEDEDAPKIISTIGKTHNLKNGLTVREELIDALGKLKNPRILPFLESSYIAVGDTVKLQLAILKAIANQKTKKATKSFVELIKSNTPIPNEEGDVYPIFHPFYDTLALTQHLYPKMLLLSILPEYKSATYALLSRAIDSNQYEKRYYRKKLNQIVWEANNEVKRQRSRESLKGGTYEEISSRGNLFSYNRDLWYYMNLLMPYQKKAKVKKYFEKIESLNAPGVALDYSNLRIRNGLVDSVDWLNLSNNANSRIALYLDLKKMNKLEALPGSITTDQLVESLYAKKSRTNVLRDSLVFLKKQFVDIPKGSGYLYFFKTMDKYETDWEYGYVGLFDSTNSEFLSAGYKYSTDINLSKYQDEALQIELQIRKFEMAHRERYKAAEEERFKKLYVKKPYY